MAVAALVLTLGLHWALLQTLAWAEMVIAYSLTVPFQEAVSMTFDGKHPCPLCDFVEQGRAQEKSKEQGSLTPTAKLDLAVVWETAGFRFTSARAVIACEEAVFPRRREPPPKPHPRPPTHECMAGD